MLKPLRNFVLVLVAALFPGSPAFAGSDLYLDGVALANRLTALILDGEIPAQTSLRKVSAPFAIQNLIEGAAFKRSNSDQVKRFNDWVLDQDEGSIMPDQLVMQAILVMDGNIELGLMLAWDYLSLGWKDPATRNERQKTRQLYDITGEFEFFSGNRQIVVVEKDGVERTLHFKTIRGDKFSAWYHFIGAAFYAFRLSNRALVPRVARARANMAVFLEETVFFDEFIDSRKRIAIDKAGVSFGFTLARHLKTYSSMQSFEESGHSRNQEYLYDSPRHYGEDWRLEEGQKAEDYVLKQGPELACRMVKRKNAIMAAKTAFLGSAFVGGFFGVTGGGLFGLFSFLNWLHGSPFGLTEQEQYSLAYIATEESLNRFVLNVADRAITSEQAAPGLEAWLAFSIEFDPDIVKFSLAMTKQVWARSLDEYKRNIANFRDDEDFRRTFMALIVFRYIMTRPGEPDDLNADEYYLQHILPLLDRAAENFR